MNIRIECYLAILKRYKEKYPDAHFEVVTRTAKSKLAPSKELLIHAKSIKMTFERYRILYLLEILDNIDALMRIEELREIAKEKIVFLICYEKDPSKSHRSILKDVIQNPKKYRNGIVFSCFKCQYKLEMDNDDYFCPSCKKLFCFNCIDEHGCNVEITPNKYIHQKWKVNQIK